MKRFVYVTAQFHSENPDDIYDGGFYMNIEHILTFFFIEYDGKPAVQFSIYDSDRTKIRFITHDVNAFEEIAKKEVEQT